MNENHWVEKMKTSNCGRPSIKAAILEMDLADYFDEAPEVFHHNQAARSLVRWLKGKGVSISVPTAKRVVHTLIDRGYIIEVPAVMNGRPSHLKTAPKPEVL